MRCLLFAVVGAHAVALKLSACDSPERVPMPADSIYPHIRQKGCGHENLGVPQLLQHEGKGRYVVDIGLGPDADETLQAVRSGFTVLGFEPMPGNVAHIEYIVDNSPDLSDKVKFIYPTLDKRGEWVFPQIERPDTQGGFAYIFLAGLSDKESTTHMPGGYSLTRSIMEDHVSSNPVAVTTLDKILPDWTSAGIHMLKIDTQGWELQILRGASRSIKNGLFKYILYEFSPWLMKWAGADQVGNAEDLLVLLPKMGGLCFDMMGSHHILLRPTSPLKAYFESLNSGRNSTHPQSKNGYRLDNIGPWDDIMCYMPGDGAAHWGDESSVKHGIEQVLKDVCV